LVKRKKRGLETVDDDAVNVFAIEAHLGVAKPELPRNGSVGDETVVGVDRHAQTEVVIELQRMAPQIFHGACLDVARRAALESDAVVIDVVKEIAIFA